MHVARTLFALCSRGATGTAALFLGDPVVEEVQIELQRGWIHGLVGAPPRPRAEDALTELLRRVDDFDVALIEFFPDEPPSRRGRVTPLLPASVLRNHVEARLAPDAAADLRARATSGARIRLVFTPHASCLGQDERPIVTLLATPRTLADLDAAQLTKPHRAARLLAFLEAVGAVMLDVAPSAYELLGVAEGVPHDELRRAYKRLARDLHPDLHPGLPEEERRALELRLAAVTAAYRRLVPG